MMIATFDDDQEEIIEFVDTCFFYFFVIMVSYLGYKYSIHYFAFLDASETKGRSISFVTKQFFKDFLNTFSLLLRFYILLFRLNVYDTLDDFFDSYYIFVGDFDDDEYLNELFLSIHGTILFTLDNHDDRSFLLEDENEAVRMGALSILANSPSADIVPALRVVSLMDQNEYIRARAVEVMDDISYLAEDEAFEVKQ